MVNGKPIMTYGGSGTPAAQGPRTRHGRFSRLMDGFSSYLPTENGKAPAAHTPAGNAPQAAAGPRPPVGGIPAALQARNQPGRVTEQAAPAVVQAALPPGGQSRAQARELARPGAKGTGPQGAYQAPVAQAERLPSRTSPRISDRPITGRGAFGMTDTRGIGRGGSTLAQRGALNYASPAANAARAQGLGAGQNPAVPTVQQYSPLSAGTGMTDVTGQSFLQYGFAAKNAELAMRNLGYVPGENRAIQTVARRLDPDPYSLRNLDYVPPGTTFGSTRPVDFPSGEDKARTAVLTRSHKRKADEMPANAYASKSLVKTFYATAEQGLGSLAAKFESGDDGIAAIGYDRKGGTSYGKYQIASRTGTMSNFISYLRSEAPDLAARLASAGPANTGGRSGKMPAEWRRIAAEDPDRFEKLQGEFIRTSHFEPAMQAIAAVTGVHFEKLPAALQEVLFSTAVQHGPAGATRIFSQAMRRVDADKLQAAASPSGRKAGQQLITQVYSLRAGQFSSSTAQVQAAVRNRLKQEMREAIGMLG